MCVDDLTGLGRSRERGEEYNNLAIICHLVILAGSAPEFRLRSCGSEVDGCSLLCWVCDRFRGFGKVARR
jgi:hypothetical protein